MQNIFWKKKKKNLYIISKCLTFSIPKFILIKKEKFKERSQVSNRTFYVKNFNIENMIQNIYNS